MTVLVVRHAHAGDRDTWEGDDRRRRLSEHGWIQAHALVDLLRGRPLDRILSSPYERCVQSVEPLARARGLEVAEHPALVEGTGLDRLHRLLRRSAGQHVVLCSHGDVIGALVHDLEQRGIDVGAQPQWPKGSVWVLDGDPGDPTARYLPPPA